MASTEPTATMPAAIAAVGTELDEPVRGRPVLCDAPALRASMQAWVSTG